MKRGEKSLSQGPRYWAPMKLFIPPWTFRTHSAIIPVQPASCRADSMQCLLPSANAPVSVLGHSLKPAGSFKYFV